MQCLNPAFLSATAFLSVLWLPMQAQKNTIFNRDAETQSMSQRWELDSAHQRGTFLVTPYKPVYVTAGRWSSNPNVQPYSENPAYSLPYPEDYNKYEAMFDLSFKTKVFQNIFSSTGSLWVAYTQKAHWQVYNSKISRPFRELNYQPEIILNFATNLQLPGMNLRMVGVSLNHQSNGRRLPLSRSWNRVILQAGLERQNWQIYLRPWFRLKDADDENPLITDYVGRGELLIIYNSGNHQFSLEGTHTLRFDNRNRGRIEGSWVFPAVKNFRLQLKVAEGYGETLVDYNHRQTTIGVSASLIQW